MYQIVASDLDGTLLTPEHAIAPYTKQVLNNLHEKGKSFVFATGRHHLDVADMREHIGIPAYMITSNGARVHNAKGEAIFKQDIQPQLVAKIMALIKQIPDAFIHIYRDDDWLLDKDNQSYAEFHKGFTYQLFDVDNPPSKDIAKIFITRDDNNHEALVPWEEALNEQFAGQLNVAFSTPWCLEIMDAGVSKGHALEAVAKEQGFELSDCIAFGDGMNDVEMLSMAGKGVLMGTAHIKVKQVLNDIEVIGSCADEAVANYLATHII